MKKFCLLLTAYCLLFAMQAIAVPQYLNYQGILRDKATGNLIDGSREMTFKIYNVSTEGTALWTMPPSNVVVSGGLYNVGIGPAGYAELASGRRWLEVEVGGETLTPRTELLAVAYAVTAVTAETAAYAHTAGSASTASSATTVVDNSITGSKLASNINVNTSGNINTSGIASAETLSIKKFTAKGTQEGFCVGTGVISGGGTSATVNNSAVSSKSFVFITPRRFETVGGNNAWLKVRTIEASSFTVTTYNESSANTNDLFFDYLIINY